MGVEIEKKEREERNRKEKRTVRINSRQIIKISMTLSDDQRYQSYLDRSRFLSPKVERCAQELIERIRKENPTFDFDLLSPPISHLSHSAPSDNKESYHDFYLVWKNVGRYEIERDDSSICCKVKSVVENPSFWSRAEQERLLLYNLDRKKKKKTYLNGRGMRDLLFETLFRIAPDLIRLDFVEYLIYFDLIIPSGTEKITCHVTFLPCLHLVNENEVLLPFGTLRWYPRSLSPIHETSLFVSFQPILQNLTVRNFISTSEIVDEASKISKKDHQDFARIRTILHELILPSTLQHVESIEQLENPMINSIFFLQHRIDRNCDIFPAGQQLINETRSKRFFREFLRVNAIVHDDEGDIS